MNVTCLFGGQSECRTVLILEDQAGQAASFQQRNLLFPLTRQRLLSGEGFEA